MKTFDQIYICNTGEGPVVKIIFCLKRQRGHIAYQIERNEEQTIMQATSLP